MNNQVAVYKDYSIDEINVIKNSVAKGTTDTELKYFISVCKSVELNPLTKEIWCYKDHRNNLLVFAGRDGFLSYAQRNPNFAGIRSCDVCANDIFELDIINPANNIHKISHKDRGQLLGAYAIVYRKDGEPTISYVNFSEYNRNVNAWKTHPAAMIKKVAETQALKLAFGMSSVQSEHEFDTNAGVAVPINHQVAVEEFQAIQAEVDKITNVEDLNHYFRSLTPEEQKSDDVIEIFKTHKEKLDGVPA